jgi:hypothetical protein
MASIKDTQKGKSKKLERKRILYYKYEEEMSTPIYIFCLNIH